MILCSSDTFANYSNSTDSIHDTLLRCPPAASQNYLCCCTCFNASQAQVYIILKAPQHPAPVYPTRSWVSCACICILKAHTCTGIPVFLPFSVGHAPNKFQLGPIFDVFMGIEKRDQKKQLARDACELDRPWASLHAATHCPPYSRHSCPSFPPCNQKRKINLIY